MLLRSFAAAVLRPAAMSAGAIDLDYATSAYWQDWWPDGDRPAAFLDGSRGRDVLQDADRRAAIPRCGAGFFNPPGLGGGHMVLQCWRLFEEDHRKQQLGSGVWIGFSLEQFASLQGEAERSPLTATEDSLITTIVPSRRARYLLHPKQLIELTRTKQKKRRKRSPLWLKEQRLIERLEAREDDRPVPGQAPTHASYVTVLWHRERAVRRQQMVAAREFLATQGLEKKSLLQRCEVIGPMDLTPRVASRRAA